MISKSVVKRQYMKTVMVILQGRRWVVLEIRLKFHNAASQIRCYISGLQKGLV
jgi:hypothetical protein